MILVGFDLGPFDEKLVLMEGNGRSGLEVGKACPLDSGRFGGKRVGALDASGEEMGGLEE